VKNREDKNNKHTPVRIFEQIIILDIIRLKCYAFLTRILCTIKGIIPLIPIAIPNMNPSVGFLSISIVITQVFRLKTEG